MPCNAQHRNYHCNRASGHHQMHSDGYHYWVAGENGAEWDRSGRVEYEMWWEDAPPIAPPNEIPRRES